MSEIGTFTQHIIGEPILRLECLVAAADAKGAPDGFDRLGHRTFVQRDADTCFTDAAQVDAFVHCGFHDRGLQGADINRHRVEEGFGIDLKAGLLQPVRQTHRLAMDALRDSLQPLGPVEHRIHGRHHRQQSLRRAHVRGRLFAADVLLAGL